MPSARSRTPATSARLSQFRGSRRPLPPGDKRVLIALLVHLCFLPWALGTMHPWSQVTSLVLAAIGFIVALTAPRADKPETGRRLGGDGEANLKPEDGLAPYSGGYGTQVSGFKSQFSRLLRFPPFWLGLALLGYIAVQAFNPSWRYVTNGTHWWLVKLPDIEWLPTSVDTPFARFNIWRQFIIYASAWLTVCTVAIGLTRRQAFGTLLTAVALNGLVLVLAGFFFRLTRDPDTLLWFEGHRLNAQPFASFIYKNHAAAYLALIAAMLLMLAARLRERALREHAPSSPALLPVIGALIVLFAMIFTYSRGGTLLLGAYLLAAGIAFALYRYFRKSESTTPRIVTFTVTSMVALVVLYALVQLDFSRATERLEQLTDPGHKEMSTRLEANMASQDMLSNTWPRGIGAGEFRYLYPQYIRRFESRYQGGQLFWEHAHNDWLQVPIELGLGGILILALGAGWWLWRLGRGAVWRNLPALLLALGSLQTLAHAAFDFPFQNPAILITWLVLLVVAVRYGAADRVEAAR